jgi:type IV secretion system protein VirD4
VVLRGATRCDERSMFSVRQCPRCLSSLAQWCAGLTGQTGMTPTKFLFGQITTVFAIVIAGVWIATQYAALKLGYQPRLGPPWITLIHLPIYHPWRLFQWWYSFEAYAPKIFDTAGIIAGASGFAAFLAAVGGSLWRARQTRLVTTYGSSRWAGL